MPIYEAPKPLGDLLLTEVHPAWSREPSLHAAGTTAAMGGVLARVAGKYHPLDPVATDGSEIAHAVAIEVVDATAGEARGVVIARGACVEASALVWPAGITDAQKSVAITQLEVRGIVVRTAL